MLHRPRGADPRRRDARRQRDRRSRSRRHPGRAGSGVRRGCPGAGGPDARARWPRRRQCRHRKPVGTPRASLTSLTGMRAVTIIDKVLAVSDMPDPEPGSGEVLVKVHAAGLNGADMMQRKGHYPAPPGAPQEIPGLELAGEVVDLGPAATRFAVGDRVMGIVGGGGQAELCTVHERILMPVPERLSWAEAGGTPEVFTTAHDAVFTQGQLLVGERLLVHGGAGGVGTAAIQLGKVAGARVTATVRNPDVRDQVAELGATVVEPDRFGEHGP